MDDSLALFRYIKNQFKMLYLEAKRINAFQKTLERGKLKGKLIGAMAQLYLQLIILCFLYFTALYNVIYFFYSLIVGSFEYISLFVIPFIFFWLWLWPTLGKRLIIFNMRDYLKKEGYYKQYEEASKHIEDVLAKK